MKVDEGIRSQKCFNEEDGWSQYLVQEFGILKIDNNKFI